MDSALSTALVNDGYGVRFLLNPDEVRRAALIRKRHGPAPGDDGNGLFNDSWSTDVSYKRRVSEELIEVMTPALSREFPAHRLLGASHIVKWPGPGGAVVAHRDPSFVDERKFRSLMVWCPLAEVNAHLGSLQVVPRSHRFRRSIRAHQDPLNEVRVIPSGASSPLNLRAGEAVVYDPALVHFSGPNDSATERVAIACAMVPQLATPLYAIPCADGQLAVLEIDEDFFVRHRLCALDTEAVLSEYRRSESVRASSPKNHTAR